MKASELRIGNLLRDKVSKTELEVVELTENNITTKVIDRSKFPLKDGWGLEYIPLTEEWLLKFGFIENEEHGYFEFDRFIVAYNDLIDSFYLCDIDVFVKIETVHHLQNLYFAIRNKELTLKP
jgi:hypothetical protein